MLYLNGFTHISSFTSVDANELNFEEWISDVKSIDKESNVAARILQLTAKTTLDNFKLPLGTRNMIKNVIKTLSTYNEESFSQHSGTSQALHSQSSPTPSTSQVTSPTVQKKIEKLPEHIDYESEIKKRLLKILSIAQPNLHPVLQMTLRYKTETSIAFETPCIFCPEGIGKTIVVSAFVSRGYLRWGVGNFVRHIKTHPEQAEHLLEAEVK
jgi:hypothetical protein